MTSQRDLFGERTIKGTTRSAVISDCGVYRYRLDRRWRAGSQVCWVMLNPSTADGDVEDATLRKISAYSKRWGHGALVVVNLFAFRSRHPKDLAGHALGGPVTDFHIRAALSESETVVCGWGASGPKDDRTARVIDVLRMIELAELEPQALAVTKAGDPGHPLYLVGSLDPRPLAGFRS